MTSSLPVTPSLPVTSQSLPLTSHMSDIIRMVGITSRSILLLQRHCQTVQLPLVARLCQPHLHKDKTHFIPHLYRDKTHFPAEVHHTQQSLALGSLCGEIMAYPPWPMLTIRCKPFGDIKKKGKLYSVCKLQGVAVLRAFATASYSCYTLGQASK